MWDGWENEYGCTRRVVAELQGYRRVFNKASIKRWGSKTAPGPTLNLIDSQHGSCRGMAFEFPISRGPSIRTYLAEREGRRFPLREHPVRISDSEIVLALVPIYEGKSLVDAGNIDELAEMVCRAVGSTGRCVDYVKDIAAKLAELHINDPAVVELLSVVERKKTSQ